MKNKPIFSHNIIWLTMYFEILEFDITRVNCISFRRLNDIKKIFSMEYEDGARVLRRGEESVALLIINLHDMIFFINPAGIMFRIDLLGI